MPKTMVYYISTYYKLLPEEGHSVITLVSRQYSISDSNIMIIYCCRCYSSHDISTLYKMHTVKYDGLK